MVADTLPASILKSGLIIESFFSRNSAVEEVILSLPVRIATDEREIIRSTWHFFSNMRQAALSITF
jgi:hypothetical protein